MQKMITITVNTRMLSADAQEAFTIREVTYVNDMLEAGWMLEEWEFLNEEPDEDGKMSLIAVMNNDAVDMDEDFPGDDDDDDFDDEGAD